jgi:uncharacterized protein YbjT (DUF2867 family)
VACRHPEDFAPGRGVAFDFFDRATWAAALSGVDVLFLLFPLPGNRAAREAIIPFIEAAERAGCRHVVYVSVFGADRARFIPHHHVERALEASSMSCTLLRCSFFMQNLHRAISTHGDDIVDHGELFIPAGRSKTTFLDARDAAEVAARVISDPTAHRADRIHHITGPRPIAMGEVADELSRVLGRPIRYTNPSVIRFARRLRRREVGWDAIGFMCAVYTLTKLGFNQQVTDDVAAILGRPPRTLAEFLEDSAWRWTDRAWT